MTTTTELRPVAARATTRTETPTTLHEPPVPISDRWPYPVRSPRIATRDVQPHSAGCPVATDPSSTARSRGTAA